MSHKPCHHECDFSDGDDPSDDSDLKDKGCCAPIPVKIDCLAPVIPPFDCDEEDPTIIADPETGRFSVLTTLFDSNCSAITDSTGSPFLTLIS